MVEPLCLVLGGCPLSIGGAVVITVILVIASTVTLSPSSAFLSSSFQFLLFRPGQV